MAAGEFQEAGRDVIPYRCSQLSSDHILGANLAREVERRGRQQPHGRLRQTGPRENRGGCQHDSSCMCLEDTGSRSAEMVLKRCEDGRRELGLEGSPRPRCEKHQFEIYQSKHQMSQDF